MEGGQPCPLLIEGRTVSNGKSRAK